MSGFAGLHEFVLVDTAGRVVSADMFGDFEVGRTMGGFSAASIQIDDRGDAREWCHELLVLENNVPVWRGPVVRIENGVLTARDATARLFRTLVGRASLADVTWHELWIDYWGRIGIDAPITSPTADVRVNEQASESSNVLAALRALLSVCWWTVVSGRVVGGSTRDARPYGPVLERDLFASPDRIGLRPSTTGASQINALLVSYGDGEQDWVTTDDDGCGRLEAALDVGALTQGDAVNLAKEVLRLLQSPELVVDASTVGDVRIGQSLGWETAVPGWWYQLGFGQASGSTLELNTVVASGSNGRVSGVTALWDQGQAARLAASIRDT